MFRQSYFESLESRLLLARPLGIDVSDYQPGVNYTSVKNAGYSFVWAKATEGFTFNATQYNTHVATATAAGMLFAPYHYARPDNNSAADEVTHFLQIAGDEIAAGRLVPMLDVENAVDPGDTVNTKAEMSAWVNAWCQGVFNATGVRPIIYTYLSYASTWLDSTVTQWSLWMAHYSGNDPQTSGPGFTPGVTPPWPTNSWSFWQYTSTGSVPGVAGNCDVDVFNGTPAQLNSWIIMSAPTTPTSPAHNGQTTGSPASLNWNAVANATSYDVYVDSVFKANVATNSWTVSPALPTGAHSWYVVAKNNTGSKTGPTWNFTVNPSVTLNAPTNMQVTGTTSANISISWTDTSTNEANQLVERKTGAAGAWSQIATLASNSTSHNDTTVAPGMTYFYRVRASGAGGFGSYGSEVSATTYAAVPAGVSASDGSSFDKVTVGWSEAAGAVSYQLYRSTTNDPLTAGLLAPSSGTSFDDTSVSPGTTYYYWVAAKDSLNRSSGVGSGDSGFRAVDNIAPQVTSAEFAYAQPSHPIIITFSENVSASLGTAQLTVQNLDAQTNVDVLDVTYDPGTNTATFLLSGPLADANYLATLSGTGVSDVQGNPLGTDYPIPFFVLTADANRDRAVDTTDFNLLATSFGGTGLIWDDGDFSYDGTVDTTDFNILAAAFGAALAAPPAGAARAPFSVARITHDPDIVEDLLN